jgi:hypothetical protein
LHVFTEVLHLACPDKRLRRIIKFTGLGSVLALHNSLEEALAARPGATAAPETFAATSARQ